MTVREAPMDRKRKESAIVSRAALDRQRGAFERAMAIILLFVSFAGSIAALSGGWPALLAAPHGGAIASGIAVQVALTAAEWWYGAGRGRWRYRLALSLDTALTAIGYGPLIIPTVTPYIAARGAGDLATVLAWGIVVIASALLAWYPEMTLID